MAGVKGRSGGHNRKSERELKLTGGYRRDRHGKRGQPSTERLDTLRELLAFHVRVHAELRRLVDDATVRISAGGKVDIKSLLRESRQQAATIGALTAAVERVEREIPPPPDPDDRFAEFDRGAEGARP